MNTIICMNSYWNPSYDYIEGFGSSNFQNFHWQDTFQK